MMKIDVPDVRSVTVEPPTDNGYGGWIRILYIRTVDDTEHEVVLRGKYATDLYLINDAEDGEGM